MRGKENYTHYEKVRILAARALQISQGAPIFIRVGNDTSPLAIAKLEWEKEIIPIDTKKVPAG